MANNLGRLFSSALQVSKPNLSLLPVCSRSQLANRLFCNTTHDHHHQDGKAESESEKKMEEEIEEKEDAAVDDDGDSLDLNEKTGEIGGPKGPEPTRFGDWERNGRCSDF